MGQVASMGSLLLAAGEKDMRFALPSARLMVRQTSDGFQGQVTDISLHAHEIQNLKNRFDEIDLRQSGQALKIEAALERGRFLIAETA